ncbi:unnamed protein product [Soboliphyme baturini]|uniref:SH2 domain-containing protein n=1 Tax=Soboliphyme baturini TaxID=241478 RepID=A0A183J5V4_9BILA|nr:unnamed protein product [Soboliphyme baturini]
MEPFLTCYNGIVLLDSSVQHGYKFQVRDSVSRLGDYVITCNWQGSPMHCAINRIVLEPKSVYEKTVYRIAKEQFPSVPALIRFYVGSKTPLTPESSVDLYHCGSAAGRLKAPPKPFRVAVLHNKNKSPVVGRNKSGQFKEISGSTDHDDYHEYCDIDYEEALEDVHSTKFGVTPPPLPLRNELQRDSACVPDITIYDQPNPECRPCVFHEVPSQLQLNEYQSELFDADSKPLDSRLWPQVETALLTVDFSQLACQLTKQDFQLLQTDSMIMAQSLWNRLRTTYTSLAVNYETQLRRIFRGEAGVGLPCHTISLPDLLPLAKLLEVNNVKCGALWDADDMDITYGIEKFWSLLEQSRFWCKLLKKWENNCDLMLRCGIEKLQPIVSEMCRTEFQLKLLWGSKGAAVNSEERYLKFDQLLDLMAERCEMQFATFS